MLRILHIAYMALRFSQMMYLTTGPLSHQIAILGTAGGVEPLHPGGGARSGLIGLRHRDGRRFLPPFGRPLRPERPQSR